MFRKMLKYDMKSVWGIWRIMAISLLGLSFVGSFVLRYILTHFEKMSESFGLAAMFAMFMLCAYLSLFASSIITMIFVYLRFYKNFFTDEGYLTFTLPIKRSTLLNAKTVNAILWYVLLYALILACAIPFSIISPPSENGELINFMIYEGIGEILGDLWNHIGAWVIVLIVGVLAVILSSTFFSVASMQLCITIGAILVKKAKVLLGIGFYYALSMIMGFAWQILNIANMLFLANRFTEYLDAATVNGQAAFLLLFMLVLAAIMSAVGFIFHSITRACIERKLNLA